MPAFVLRCIVSLSAFYSAAHPLALTALLRNLPPPLQCRFVVFCADVAVTALFRFLAFATLSVGATKGLSGMAVLFYLFTAGFMIVRDRMSKVSQLLLLHHVHSAS